MYITNQNNNFISNIHILKNTRIMIIAAIFVSISIVLGKMLVLNIGMALRISFENLPILMAGIFFGPFIGGTIGFTADIIGCFIIGYEINPIITLGAASIGIVSGIVSITIFRNKKLINTFLSIILAHTLGSIFIKTIGLYIYYKIPFEVLILRIPLYIGTGLLEFVIIYILFRNRIFSAQLDKVLNYGKLY